MDEAKRRERADEAAAESERRQRREAMTTGRMMPIDEGVGAGGTIVAGAKEVREKEAYAP